ncbi:hypothetical protein BJY00DRAFT_216795 [Aspergillus carlsbadensis]|nr:hypothetical protein BJY00DRAFT_216795 [Aspergillus carlsbadensis]
MSSAYLDSCLSMSHSAFSRRGFICSSSFSKRNMPASSERRPHSTDRRGSADSACVPKMIRPSLTLTVPMNLRPSPTLVSGEGKRSCRPGLRTTEGKLCGFLGFAWAPSSLIIGRSRRLVGNLRGSAVKIVFPVTSHLPVPSSVRHQFQAAIGLSARWEHNATSSVGTCWRDYDEMLRACRIRATTSFIIGI